MSEIGPENKEALIQREMQNMQGALTGGAWTGRAKIALACRILCSHGHESGLAGQITTRESDGLFFTQRLGCGLREVRASNLLKVDDDLNVIEGTGMPNPANRFHGWIYRARPEVRCIVHTHPTYSSALSMLGIALVISHMDTCALYDNVAFLDHWPGVPVGNEEGRIISGALGDKAGLLLAHHGVVIVGRSVEEACVLALQFERAAQLQLLAGPLGLIRSIQPDLAIQARGWLSTRPRIDATFAYHARAELGRDPQSIT